MTPYEIVIAITETSINSSEEAHIIDPSLKCCLLRKLPTSMLRLEDNSIGLKSWSNMGGGQVMKPSHKNWFRCVHPEETQLNTVFRDLLPF